MDKTILSWVGDHFGADEIGFEMMRNSITGDACYEIHIGSSFPNELRHVW